MQGGTGDLEVVAAALSFPFESLRRVTHGFFARIRDCHCPVDICWLSEQNGEQNTHREAYVHQLPFELRGFTGLTI